MVRWFQSLFAWRPIRNTGVWLYEQNNVTGQRRAIDAGGCWQPLDWDFMRAGDIVVSRRGRYVIGTDAEIIIGG